MSDQLSGEQIQIGIKNKYAKVATSAKGFFKYPTGREGAHALGYDPTFLSNMKDTILDSFCGVGNPFSVGPVHEGDTVLDIGCGAGFDLIVASNYTGESGSVYGIDITPEMREKANRNVQHSKSTNITVLEGTAETLPFSDNFFDVILSNGVLNLTTDKEKAFHEAFRTLKTGGRFQFADIVLKQALPEETLNSIEAWSN